MRRISSARPFTERTHTHGIKNVVAASVTQSTLKRQLLATAKLTNQHVQFLMIHYTVRGGHSRIMRKSQEVGYIDKFIEFIIAANARTSKNERAVNINIQSFN